MSVDLSSPVPWVAVASLAVAVASLATTIAIFRLGRRLSFRQQRERAHELRVETGKIVGPMHREGLNTKVIVMNVDRYRRDYDGSNDLTWRGWAYHGYDLVEVVHGGIEVSEKVVDTFTDATGRRSLKPSNRPAGKALACGHIPWEWIEHIEPDGDEFDGAPILFVAHHAPGRRPFNFVRYREARAIPIGLHQRDYFSPIPDLGTRTPRRCRDWREFHAAWRRMRGSRQCPQ